MRSSLGSSLGSLGLSWNVPCTASYILMLSIIIMLLRSWRNSVYLRSLGSLGSLRSLVCLVCLRSLVYLIPLVPLVLTDLVLKNSEPGRMGAGNIVGVRILVFRVVVSVVDVCVAWTFEPIEKAAFVGLPAPAFSRRNRHSKIVELCTGVHVRTTRILIGNGCARGGTDENVCASAGAKLNACVW